ncbi:MAG: hypothetical protein M3N32_11740 [Actinomycetota bacterium]|nr:hypothetical protein [Actinomycetota bacterium]
MARLRRLAVDDLPEIDAPVEASIERIDGYSPDELVWAVERASDELDGARKLQRREQRRVAASFLSVQPCLDGSISASTSNSTRRRRYRAQRFGGRLRPPQQRTD